MNKKLMLKKKTILLLILLIITPIIVIWPNTLEYFYRYGSVLLVFYLMSKIFKFLDKKFKKNEIIKIPIIVMMVPAVIMILLTEEKISNFLSIGKMINRFYPCQFDTMQSTFSYCYQIYDVYAYLALIGIFIISFLTTISTTIYCVIKRKNYNIT